MLRQSGGEYFNPDEAARVLRERDPSLAQADANALAWGIGLRQLDRALDGHHDYFFESTLGGRTITARLGQALASGLEVRVWYIGLGSVETHIARVAARVLGGGHDIPEDDIRNRYDTSRRNLVRLLPALTELKLYDNSEHADLGKGEAPKPRLLLHWCAGRIMAPSSLRETPEWAKPIVAQALRHTEAVQ